LTVDHVIPTTLGGGDEPTNLVTACAVCNGGKASIAPDGPVVADVEADAIRWRLAIEQAALYRALDRAYLATQVGEIDTAWCRWRTNKGHGEVLSRPAGWRSSVERFIALGLTADEQCRLVDVAMERQVSDYDTWRYFCGCCWRAITELQETARQLIEDDRVIDLRKVADGAD
jgi:hypothetical protein